MAFLLMNELLPGYLVKFGPISVLHALKQRSPLLWDVGSVSWKTIFPQGRWAGGGFRMNQAHYMYCVFYIYCYYISTTSDHQALDRRLGTPALENKDIPY